MGFRFPNEPQTVTARNRDVDGNLVSADTAVIKARVSQGTVTTSAPTETTTGVYSSVVTPSGSGWLECRFELTTGGVLAVEERRFRIDQGWFESENNTNDYA